MPTAKSVLVQLSSGHTWNLLVTDWYGFSKVPISSHSMITCRYRHAPYAPVTGRTYYVDTIPLSSYHRFEHYTASYAQGWRIPNCGMLAEAMARVEAHGVLRTRLVDTELRDASRSHGTHRPRRSSRLELAEAMARVGASTQQQTRAPCAWLPNDTLRIKIAQHPNSRCVLLPAPLVPGVPTKTRLESSIKK